MRSPFLAAAASLDGRLWLHPAAVQQTRKGGRQGGNTRAQTNSSILGFTHDTLQYCCRTALRHCRSEHRTWSDVRGCNRKLNRELNVHGGRRAGEEAQAATSTPTTYCCRLVFSSAITILTEGISGHVRVLLSLPLDYCLRSPGRVEVVSQRRHLHTIGKKVTSKTEEATSSASTKNNCTYHGGT